MPTGTVEPLKKCRLVCGAHQQIGGRKYQEDRFQMIADLNKYVPEKDRQRAETTANRALFAVYDGFAGFRASEYLKNEFHRELAKHPDLIDQPVKALEETFQLVDRKLCEFITKRMDPNKPDRVGSCASVALFVTEEPDVMHMYVANVGDSNAVLFHTKHGDASRLSDEHKASWSEEQARIEQVGGHIEQKYHSTNGFLCIPSKQVPLGPARLRPGGLAVTRGFGAVHAKKSDYGGNPKCFIVEPHITNYTVTTADMCLVVASDGVWDNCKKYDQLHKSLKDPLSQGGKEMKYQQACDGAAEMVVHFSFKHSPDLTQQDNTTAIVVLFIWE